MEIENSYDVLRRLPIYRTEVRHVGWRDELRYVGHWWSSWMRLVPHYHVGNNWYVVGWNWGAVLMPNQGWSPMYMSVRVPVYAAVPVFSHWHLYTERVYVSTWDWEDDIEGDFGHYGTEGGLTVNDLATEMSRMLVVLPKKCIDPKGCFKPACELLGFDQNICSMNQRVHTPQWWKDRVRESPRTDRNYSSASAALRVTLGAAPADKRGERWGWAAHHIIAAYHRRGVWQRIMAEKCRIHPNESVNGVYLRGSNRKGGTTGYGRLSDGLQRRAYHPTLHTIGYFESVNYYLLDAIHGKDCDSGHARRQLDFINDYLRKNPS